MTRITGVSIMKVTRTTRFVLLYYTDIAQIFIIVQLIVLLCLFLLFISLQNHKFKVS